MKISAQLYNLLSHNNFLVSIKRQYDLIERVVYIFRQRIRKHNRFFFPERTVYKTPHIFGILAVKKTEYVEMAIFCINSLHFLNPTHRVRVYCDTVCYKYFQQYQKALDYPNKVEILHFFKKKEKAWQESKLETCLDISMLDGILVDADSRWYSEPILEEGCVYFLVEAYPFRDSPLEMKILASMFKKTRKNVSMHHVTGFVKIPKKFITKKFTTDLWSIYSRLNKVAKDGEMKRLREELTLNIALQLHVPKNKIKTLKKIDSPGNKDVLLSYYYGCWNRVLN